MMTGPVRHPMAVDSVFIALKVFLTAVQSFSTQRNFYQTLLPLAHKNN
jgi:hypothetical protein